MLTLTERELIGLVRLPYPDSITRRFYEVKVWHTGRGLFFKKTGEYNSLRLNQVKCLCTALKQCKEECVSVGEETFVEEEPGVRGGGRGRLVQERNLTFIET